MRISQTPPHLRARTAISALVNCTNSVDDIIDKNMTACCDDLNIVDCVCKDDSKKKDHEACVTDSDCCGKASKCTDHLCRGHSDTTGVLTTG